MPLSTQTCSNDMRIILCCVRHCYTSTTLTPKAALNFSSSKAVSLMCRSSDKAVRSKIRSHGVKHLSLFVHSVSICWMFLKWAEEENHSPAPPARVCNQSVRISRAPQVTYAALASLGRPTVIPNIKCTPCGSATQTPCSLQSSAHQRFSQPEQNTYTPSLLCFISQGSTRTQLEWILKLDL